MIGLFLLLPIQLIMPATAQGQATVLNSNGYLNSVGLYHVVGEVQNSGSSAIMAVLDHGYVIHFKQYSPRHEFKPDDDRNTRV